MCHKVLKLKSDTSVYVGEICLVPNCPLQKRICLCKAVCQWALVEVKPGKETIKTKPWFCYREVLLHEDIFQSLAEYVQL